MTKVDNIILFGFLDPTVKTQIAKLFSEKAGIKYFNTIEELTKKKKLTFSQIISRWGIEELIELELKFLKRFRRKKGYLICTSHYIIFSEKGLETLRKHGTLIYLNDSLSNFLKYQKNYQKRLSEEEVSKKFKDLDFLCNRKKDIAVDLKWRKGEVQAGETIKEILDKYIAFNKIKIS